MVGTTSLTAPNSASRSVVEMAWSLVRGTSTRQPNSGLVSNQDSSSRSATGAPTTASTGRCRAEAVTFAAASASVAVSVRCSVEVPWLVTATGVAPSRPAASRSPSAAATTAGSPITTTVTSSPVERAQSTLVSCGVITCTAREDLVVNGTPA